MTSLATSSRETPAQDPISERRGVIVRRWLSYVWWPALACGALTAVTLLIDRQHAPFPAFAVVYAALFTVIFVLERLCPHERKWNERDGQLVPDASLTIVGTALPAELTRAALAFGFVGMSGWTQGWLDGSWPLALPLWAQVAIALLLYEIGAYTAHRLAHAWPLLWRFHAVHHSAPRLYLVNTGRFHPLDTVESVLLAFPLLMLVGAPQEALFWVAGITSIVGVLSHCNIEMRLGFLNYIFNTPAVHRWHHSRILDEANHNYGENLMLLDVLFGTHYAPRGRRPPADVGIDRPMPTGLAGLLAIPFVWNRGREALNSFRRTEETRSNAHS